MFFVSGTVADIHIDHILINPNISRSCVNHSFVEKCSLSVNIHSFQHFKVLVCHDLNVKIQDYSIYLTAFVVPDDHHHGETALLILGNDWCSKAQLEVTEGFVGSRPEPSLQATITINGTNAHKSSSSSHSTSNSSSSSNSGSNSSFLVCIILLDLY